MAFLPNPLTQQPGGGGGPTLPSVGGRGRGTPGVTPTPPRPQRAIPQGGPQVVNNQPDPRSAAIERAMLMMNQRGESAKARQHDLDLQKNQELAQKRLEERRRQANKADSEVEGILAEVWKHDELLAQQEEIKARLTLQDVERKIALQAATDQPFTYAEQQAMRDDALDKYGAALGAFKHRADEAIREKFADAGIGISEAAERDPRLASVAQRFLIGDSSEPEVDESLSDDFFRDYNLVSARGRQVMTELSATLERMIPNVDKVEREKLMLIAQELVQASLAYAPDQMMDRVDPAIEATTGVTPHAEFNKETGLPSGNLVEAPMKDWFRAAIHAVKTDKSLMEAIINQGPEGAGIRKKAIDKLTETAYQLLFANTNKDMAMAMLDFRDNPDAYSSKEFMYYLGGVGNIWGKTQTLLQEDFLDALVNNNELTKVEKEAVSRFLSQAGSINRKVVTELQSKTRVDDDLKEAKYEAAKMMMSMSEGGDITPKAFQDKYMAIAELYNEKAGLMHRIKNGGIVPELYRRNRDMEEYINLHGNVVSPEARGTIPLRLPKQIYKPEKRETRGPLQKLGDVFTGQDSSAGSDFLGRSGAIPPAQRLKASPAPPEPELMGPQVPNPIQNSIEDQIRTKMLGKPLETVDPSTLTIEELIQMMSSQQGNRKDGG